VSAMKRALVTGGAGFIGSHLIRALIGRGVEVVVLDDLSNGLMSNIAEVLSEITFCEASILDESALREAGEGCDTIFHLAAVSNVSQTIETPLVGHAVNATGVMNVLQLAREIKAHVVYSSSAAVYGDTAPHPKIEAGPFDPLSLYGSQKFFGELLLRNYGRIFDLSSVCLRYFNVYGPRQRPDSPYSGVISIFVDRSARDLPITIFGDGSQTRDFVSVLDVVRANLAAAEARTIRGEAFNVCTGVETTVRELAELVIRELGSKSEIILAPPRAADIAKSRGSFESAESVLGFRSQVAFETGLRDLLTHSSQS